MIPRIKFNNREGYRVMKSVSKENVFYCLDAKNLTTYEKLLNEHDSEPCLIPEQFMIEGFRMVKTDKKENGCVIYNQLDEPQKIRAKGIHYCIISN